MNLIQVKRVWNICTKFSETWTRHHESVTDGHSIMTYSMFHRKNLSANSLTTPHLFNHHMDLYELLESSGWPNELQLTAIEVVFLLVPYQEIKIFQDDVLRYYLKTSKFSCWHVSTCYQSILSNLCLHFLEPIWQQLVQLEVPQVTRAHSECQPCQ